MAGGNGSAWEGAQGAAEGLVPLLELQLLPTDGGGIPQQLSLPPPPPLSCWFSPSDAKSWLPNPSSISWELNVFLFHTKSFLNIPHSLLTALSWISPLFPCHSPSSPKVLSLWCESLSLNLPLLQFGDQSLTGGFQSLMMWLFPNQIFC